MWRLRAAGRAVVSGVRPIDAVVAAVLLAVGLADALTQQEYAGGTTRLAIAAALQTAPVLVRRTRPAIAVGVSLLGVLVEVAGVRAYGGAYGLITFLVLVHATSRWGSGAQRHTATALLAGGAVTHVLSQQADGPLGLLGNALVVAVLAGAAWLLGRVTRAAESRDAELELRRAELLEEERARISRELHDVVGHALAGISLTAGAAEPRAQHDPGTASALALIRTMSRDAAADVRRLVGLLREETDSATSREPRPTLESVPQLVERARAAGLTVRHEEHGVPAPVPPGLQLAAYRVVQEGLTNAVKHAQGAEVVVTVSWCGGSLEVAVADSGGTDTSAGAPPGHGLLGLEERVRLYDGELTAGREGDGYRLRARFPLP